MATPMLNVLLNVLICSKSNGPHGGNTWKFCNSIMTYLLFLVEFVNHVSLCAIFRVNDNIGLKVFK